MGISECVCECLGVRMCVCWAKFNGFLGHFLAAVSFCGSQHSCCCCCCCCCCFVVAPVAVVVVIVVAVRFKIYVCWL